MPVYNAGPYVAKAITSILNQTLKNFELIIIDDGSTDNSTAVLRAFTDRRMVFLDNKTNKKLTATLNRGIAHAQGEFIARMDADDIAAPSRFERQAAFLDANPQVGILGSACIQIDACGNTLGVKHKPTSDLEIRWKSLTENPFIHPSVLMRREVLVMLSTSYPLV